MKCTSSLHSEDICAIIKTCSKSNVLKFDFEGLSIRFAPPPGPADAMAPGQAHEDRSYYIPNENALDPAEMGSQGEMRQRFEIQDKHILEDVRRSNLLTSDPSAWEEEQIREAIENDRRVNGEA